MSRSEKFDGVVTAVRYAPDGQVDWVRAYERRGPAFSDRLMIHRAELIEKLKAGKKFVVGERVTYMGANFQVSDEVKLRSANGGDVLVTGSAPTQANQDTLTGVPIL